MILTMNQKEMELGGKYLDWLREANDLLGDREALQARLKEDGYLLIRGLHDPEKVKATADFSSKSWTKMSNSIGHTHF